MNPFKIIPWFLLFLASAIGAGAQDANTKGDLFNEILRQDSLLFSAFNTRNVTGFAELLAKDLEFYHDRTGLTDYSYSVESLKRTAALNNGLNRQLVAGSMEVYPLGSYGAVQIASHTFCHPEAGRQDCGTFKFVHVWRKTPGGWKLARVVSYGH